MFARWRNLSYGELLESISNCLKISLVIRLTQLQALYFVTNSPFHDPQHNPLPDTNDIEQKAANSLGLYSLQQEDGIRSPSPHIKQDIRRLRNALIWLMVIGAAAGVILGLVAAIILKRTGLLDTPKPVQESTYEQPSSIR